MKYTTKIYCDICNKLRGSYENNVPDYNFIILEHEKELKSITMDLCDECREDLIKYVQHKKEYYNRNKGENSNDNNN